jgi:hypothetical protein
VIVSGLGRAFREEDRRRPVRVGDRVSGESVVEEFASLSSSAPDLEDGAGDASLIVGRGSPRISRCFVRIFRVMRDWEKGLLLGSGGDRYSSTVDRIAVVISSREVYGKQMLRATLWRKKMNC